MSLHIDQIRIDGGTQSRAAINETTVQEYAEAMADPNTVFPPAIVYFDGKEYWLADGFHRLEAWRRIGRAEIPTEIRQGDRRRAILHSVAANSAHGLRRTNDDKRRAVLTLLEDAEWSQWSDREIARRCAVSPSFVGSLRAPSVHDGQMDETRTVQRGGTTYQQKVANIGERSKPDQEIDGQKPLQNEGDAPAQTDGQAHEPNPDQELPDPETAKVIRELSKMTPEGVADLVTELRTALADEKAARAKAEAESRDLKAQMKDLTADDRHEVIVRLQRQLRHAGNEKLRAQEEQRRAMRQVYALNKRVEELERMEIPL